MVDRISTRVVEALASDRKVSPGDTEGLENAETMSPVEEMEMIERFMQAMPVQRDATTAGLRTFSEVKEFNVKEWLERVD